MALILIVGEFGKNNKLNYRDSKRVYIIYSFILIDVGFNHSHLNSTIFSTKILTPTRISLLFLHGVQPSLLYHLLESLKKIEATTDHQC